MKKMRRNHIYLVILAAVIVLSFISCQDTTGKLSAMPDSDLAEVTNAFFEYLENEPMESYGNAAGEEFLSIQFERINDGEYMIIAEEPHWDKILFFGKKGENGYAISDPISAGLSRTFEADLVSLSQGDFFMTFSASHMGSVSMILSNKEYPYERVFESHNAVDVPLVGSHISGEYYDEAEYGFTLPDAENVDEFIISAICAGDRLTPNFMDLNGDGHTNIRFDGLQYKEVAIDGGAYDGKFIYMVYYCSSTYMFDPEKNEFVLDEEAGEYRKLSEEIRDFSMRSF